MHIALESQWQWSILATDHAAKRCTGLKGSSSNVVPIRPRASSQGSNTRPQGLARRDRLAALFSVPAELGGVRGQSLAKRGVQSWAAVFSAFRGRASTAGWRSRVILRHLMALGRPMTVS